jgi:hydrogenase maturation factor HypF (carbamoyltransferase family)
MPRIYAMGLTDEMTKIFKRIHREVFISLLLGDFKVEEISEYLHEIDDIIKKILHFLDLKQELDEDEKKHLSEIRDDIKKIYDSIEKDKLQEKYHELFEKIRNEELKMVQEAVNESEINQAIEEDLGKLHDVLERLINLIKEMKYSEPGGTGLEASNMFDAIFRIETANDLLEQLKIIQQQYKEECVLMSEVEELEKQIRNGEKTLQQLLDETGIDPAKEGIEITSIDENQLKPLLLKIMRLAAALRKQKNEE